MSPSQAMNNHSAPSVRLHPPGLVHSLLCFCSLSWLGIRSLPTQQLLFFGHGTQMLCLCLALSVCVRLFSFFFFPNPCFFSLFSLISFSLRLLLSESLTQTPQSNEQADYVRGKRADKKRGKEDVLSSGE